LTQTGARAGTPAYMAPEQKAGEPPSSRSDVYSFCVTIREAVTGARPGGTAARRAPAWLERIVARGLRARPEERWPTMRALLDALARGPRVTPGRVAAAVGVVALASAATVFARDRALAAGARPLCPAPDYAFDGVWDDARRASVERSMRSSGHDASLGYVLRTIDGYRDTWSRAEVDTCEATRVHGQQSEQLLDLRMGCLDDRRRSLERTVSLLANADGEVAGHAVEIVSGVPGVESCAQVRSLEESAAPATSAAEAVARAKAAIDDGRDLFLAGKNAEARSRMEPAIAEMTQVGYAPLLGQLLYWRGKAERDSGLDRECMESLIAGTAQALEARDDRTLARISTFHGFVLMGRPEEARGWIDLAGAAIRRLGGDDELEGERLLSLGRILSGRSEAQQAFLRARELLVKTRGEDYYLVATCDQNLGNIALAGNQFDEAVRYHTRALELRRRLFGNDHVSVTSSTFNVAEDLIGRGRPAEAREALRDLGTRIGQHNAMERAWYALKLGDIARLERDLAGALEQDRRAFALYDAATDPQNPLRALPLFEAGDDLLELGRPKEAIAPLESAARLYLLQDESHAADAWFDLGRAYFGIGEPARARELVVRAQAAYVKYPDETDPDMLKKANAWLALHG
jgi:eukaryotic-like serine/threonine-protein kinase